MENGHHDTIFPHFNIEDKKENRRRKNHTSTGSAHRSVAEDGDLEPPISIILILSILPILSK
jgi:hypothetical protein